VNRIILRDVPADRWLQFDDPLEIVETFVAGDIMDKLRYIEEAVSTKGCHAAGMISYGASPGFDPSLAVSDDGEFPLLWFGLYDQPRIVVIPRTAIGGEDPQGNWVPSVSQDEYRQAFHRIKDYLQDGDSYQVNYTYRLTGPGPTDPSDLWQFFCKLAAAQKSCFGAFIHTDKWVVCSVSPELFFRLEGRKIESRPMKGTTARGLTHEQDLQQALELQKSEKNRAENLMICDMVRNDMGRIAEKGTVSVTGLFELEKYPTLWQMVSTVRAETRASIAEIFKAMFPPASITGAPKKRTMEIIHELETTPRRIYTGSIGFISPGPERAAQFNVAIRSLLLAKESGRSEYGTGGGIVADSECENEWQECSLKTRILQPSKEPFAIFESLLWTPGEGYRFLERHLARIIGSAEYFDYPVNGTELGRHLKRITQRLPSTAHKIRIFVSEKGEVTSDFQKLVLPRNDLPVHVTLARSPVKRTDPFLYHKTTNRGVYSKALSERPGYEDVILFNEEGEVTESTRANILVERAGIFLTPPLGCGLLPGIFRADMLERNRVLEKPVKVLEILHDKDIFIVNSVRGMVRVILDIPE
jgi:para-aminobenzoate synthetase / 4-amino-4-deoxychorismate lyase